jgi:3-oxoacyl-[acyl-carrier protein] reductase
MGTLNGRAALVTGAAGAGMGRSIALTLAREGAKVAVNYRSSQADADAVVAHIRGQGGAAVSVKADVSQPQECQNLFAAAADALGHVDICIVSPGAGWHPEPLHELDVDAALDDARRELAPFYALLRLALPGMYERSWGRFVAISQLPPYNSPAFAYNAAKAGRTGAARVAARDAWQRGVTINTIAPGPVDHIESLVKAVELCEHGPAWQHRTNVTPQDIAEGVAFLCSDAGRFIAGCDLPYLWR